MPLVQLFLAVAVFVIGSLLRKGPPNAQPANFEDFGFPDVDPSKRIPIIWGKRRVSGIHTMDVQGFRTKKIRKGNFISGRTTVGFRYYAGVAVGICRGSDDGVVCTKILLDNKVLWEGTTVPTDTGYTININEPEFFGSAGGVDDGVKGTIRFYAGQPTQEPDSWFVTKHTADGLPTPAYRHACYAVFEDFYWGNQPTIRQLEFVVERYPDTLGIGASRKVNTTPNVSPSEGAVDLALPEIVHEVLTNDDWGLGENALTEILGSGFTSAATTLAGEGNAASLIWNSGDSIEELLRILAQQMNSFIFKRLDTGEWQINLARGDYLNEASPLNNGDVALEVDEDNATLINYSRGSWNETVNMVRVNWNDRNLKGRPQPADAQDMANFDIQGEIQLQTYTLPGVHSPELAAKMSGRFLKELSFPLAVAELVLDRQAFNVLPGDIVRFSWAPLGIQQIYMRVVRIGYGEVDQSEIRLNLVQDVFGVAATSFGFPQGSLGTPQNPDPLQIDTAYVLDMGPWTSQQDSVDNPLKLPKPMHLVAAPQGNALQYTPFTSDQDTTEFTEEDAAYDFASYGTLQADIDPEDADRDGEYYASVVIENVNDVTDLDDSVTYTDSEIRQGAGMIVIESENPGSPPIGSPQQPASPGSLSVPEYLAYESLSIAGDTVTLTNVHYALDDTVPRRHLAGARVWFVTGGIGVPVRTFVDGDTAQLKFRNETTSGNADITGAQEYQREMRERINLPLPPGNIAFIGKGGTLGSPTSKSGAWPFPTFVMPSGAIRITFGRRDKLSTDMYLQNDGDPGLSFRDTSPQYNIELEIWRGTAGLETLLRTESFDNTTGGGETFFDYTKAAQIADGGPFNRYMIVLRSYEGPRSPRSEPFSLVEQRRYLKYDPVFASPMYPSPISPFPTFPPSPTSPRYGSPVVSPLSPIHSPLSPVPSPTSPFPFLSPRSPLQAPSPIPSPVPAFAAMARAIGPGGPQLWIDFEFDKSRFEAVPFYVNKGTYGSIANLSREDVSSLPAELVNVKNRRGHEHAFRLPENTGASQTNRDPLSMDDTIPGKTGSGYPNISSPRASTGTIFIAFRFDPQNAGLAIGENQFRGHDDHAIWHIETSGGSYAISMAIAAANYLGNASPLNSPIPSPSGRGIRVTLNGGTTDRSYHFWFPTHYLADGDYHTFAIVRPTRGSRSPDRPEFYIDGLPATPVWKPRNSLSRADVWLDDMNSTLTALYIGTLDTINKGGADIDEFLIWDNYDATAEEMFFLHGSYAQEDLFSQSPHGKESPFPSPKQIFSPLPSPLSPNYESWTMKQILLKLNPLILWDFGTVGEGSPRLVNEGIATQDYDLLPQDSKNPAVSPIFNRSPLDSGIQFLQGQGADASVSPSQFVRFPQSPPMAWARNFEQDSPTAMSPLELKNFSHNSGALVMVFRIQPTSPRNDAGGYLASYEYSGSNWGWQVSHSATTSSSTIRVEWYTSTGSSADLAITTPTGRRMDDNRWHVLVITKPVAYAASSPLTRKTDPLEMYLDGEPVDYVVDASQLEHWFDQVTLLQQNMIWAMGGRGLATSSREIQTAAPHDWQYFALGQTHIDRRRAKWMWDAFNRGVMNSPRQSPFKSPSSPIPSPLSPVHSPISPLPSPISPWTEISPHSPIGSPINPSPVPAFEDIQALGDLVLEYNFNTETISPRIIQNTGSLGDKGDLNEVAASLSPADYTIGVGGDQSNSPVQSFNFTGSPSQNMLFRTLDASPNASVVFDLPRGCVTVAFRVPSGIGIPSQGAHIFAMHVSSTEYLRVYLQSDGKLVGYWRPNASSSFERLMRSDNDMRDDRWHVAHFNFYNTLSFGGTESPNYGRMYVDGKYQNDTANTIDSGGRSRWINEIEPIGWLMVGGWLFTAPPTDAATKYPFRGEIDYISVSADPMREVWIEGAASSYHKGRNSPAVSPI